MKTKINLVSLLTGAALGAVAVITIGAASSENLSCGRFQLLAAENNNLFKIDTATGQVWRTWVTSPSNEFMRPNIGAPAAAAKSSPPSLEKNTDK